jgi:DNA-binding MarR family transcriptional regulator
MAFMSAQAAGLGLTEAGAALGLFLRSHRVLFDEVDRELRDQMGLSFALWEVLAVLAQAPGDRLRMVDVTRRMCVSKSNVTQLIDRLEESGLVARESSKADRRLTYAALTKRGARAARRGVEIFNAAAKEHFARYMDEEEIKNVASGLMKVLRGLEPDSLASEATA